MSNIDINVCPASQNSEFSIFQKDKLANTWRSATFQTINAAITASQARYTAQIMPVVKLYTANFSQAVDRIRSLLSHVALLSKNVVSSEVDAKIDQIVRTAVDIALQFGVQMSQLRLVVPNRGQKIQIGEEFHECDDGDCNKGDFMTVDLVVFPGVQRIGDGRSNMTSKRTIIPCDVYPSKSGS